MRIWLKSGFAIAALATVLLGCNNGNDASGGSAGRGVRHVFIIILENKGFTETFGENSPAPYLAKTLTSAGQLLNQYYGTGHFSLTNYVALVSGQGPNAQTQSDCQLYTDFLGLPALGPDGQAIGAGCVYPVIVKTVVDQLEEKRFTWKGYMEDMGNDLERDGSATCAHPALNSQDHTQTATAGDQYAARHNPFMYFHSIIDDQARCDAHVVPLTRLEADLASAARTPNYVFITPNLCNDGHDPSFPSRDPTLRTCKDGAPGGLVSADAFLRKWVPKILASPAFRRDGLLIITFDEAEAEANQPGEADASACCGEVPGPNAPLPGIFGLGGGRTGAVLLSPFIRPGTVNDTPYNHYSMLRSIEDMFGLDHLGYAAAAGLKPFGNDVFGD